MSTILAPADANATRRRIQDRRPQLSGQFYASPVELRLYGSQLGLDFADRAIIEAIDSFPPGWDITREAIADAAGCSVARVKRTLSKLAGENAPQKLIARTDRFFNRQRCGTSYDLTPLWDALAEIARRDGSTQDEGGFGSLRAERPAHDEPSPLDVLPQEESRSRRSGVDVDEATGETTTTTTTTDPLDAGTVTETDVEYLFGTYELEAEISAGRVPRRRPEDVEAARRLAVSFDEQAARMEPRLAQAPDPCALADELLAWNEFESVVGWAFEDPFTRPNVSRGLADLADRYDAIAAKRASMPRVECWHCGDGLKHRLTSSQQRDHERHEHFICDSCQSQGHHYCEAF